jgi:SAM-dependent methyltransferase
MFFVSSIDELRIIQNYLKLHSGNILLCSSDPNSINSFLGKRIQTFSSDVQPLSDYVDNLLLTNIFHKELLKYNQKFDTIIIHNLLEQIKHPDFFLKSLVSILNENGIIICTVSNFFHIDNIVNLFVGFLTHNKFNTNFYDLDSFLTFLNKNNLQVSKLFRLKKEFSSSSANLDKTLIPQKLIDMIKKIPDHDVSQYVLMIGKNKTIPSKNLQFTSQFPKNYLLPQLQNFFDEFTELEKSVSNKDTLISGLENSIKEQKDYPESALSKKDTLISGLENSIKEQKDYTEGLQQQIDSLELFQKKLKFWKR